MPARRPLAGLRSFRRPLYRPARRPPSRTLANRVRARAGGRRVKAGLLRVLPMARAAARADPAVVVAGEGAVIVPPMLFVAPAGRQANDQPVASRTARRPMPRATASPTARGVRAAVAAPEDP